MSFVALSLVCPLTPENRAAILAVLGAIEFIPEGRELKVHREHPDWDLPLSPYYVNLRVKPEGPLEEWQARLIGQDLALWYRGHHQLSLPKDGFQIVGVPNTGVPLAQGFLEAWPKKGEVTLIEMKKAGGGKGVIVPVDPSAIDDRRPIILIDDVITKGGSKQDALTALGDYRRLVMRIVVVVDREQGGREEMAEQGIELCAVMRFSRILACVNSLGLINNEMCDRCFRYPAELDAAIAAHQT